jgi:hypothetical protein
MAKSLPIKIGVIMAGLLKAAVWLMVGVYEFCDANIAATDAFKRIEAAAKEIERLVRALKKTF